MTQIGLILAINIAGLAFAGILARWLVSCDPGPGAARRLGAAIRRAIDSFLWRGYRGVAVVVGLVLLVLVFLHGTSGGQRLGDFEAAFWSAVLALAGAVGACVVAHLGALLAQQAGPRVVSVASHGVGRAIVVSMRAGGAAALTAGAVGAMGCGAVFLLSFALQGGLSPHADPRAIVWDLVPLLPSYALGAAAAALHLQYCGSTYQASVTVGGSQAGWQNAALASDDARNPALVADLVGDLVGLAAGRCLDFYVTATLAGVTAVILGMAVDRTAGGVTAMTIATLPLLVCAFGVIASSFGIMVVRTGEGGSPGPALWRGQIATTIIVLGGLAGTSIWLLPDHWLPFFASGALGCLAATTIAHSGRVRFGRRLRPLKESLEALRVASALLVAQGIGIGLTAAVVPVLALGLAISAVWSLGASTPLPGGGAVAVLTMVTSMLAVGPFVLAVGTLGPIAENARGVLAMHSSGAEDAGPSTSRLDELGFVEGETAQTYLVLVSGLTAAAAATAVATLAGASGGARTWLDCAHPAIAWSGAVGAVLVVAYAGGATRAATRAALAMAHEVERQLRRFPRERGVRLVPEGFTPSYRACTDLAESAALRRVLVPVAAALLLPLGFGFLLHLTYRSVSPGVPAGGLVAFIIAASVAGLGSALAISAARTAMVAARRAHLSSGGTLDAETSGTGDAVADILGNSAAPAAHLLVKAVAAVALTLAPFMT